jgi:hypothetical protein
MRSFTTRFLAPLAAGLTMIAGAHTAAAQDLNMTVSCVEGFVEGYDWAELSANFREYGWDSRATLRLVAQDESTTLVVLDINNQPVCENVADLRTSCTWTLSPGGVYNARIDNTNRATSTSYRLCAG